MPNTGERQRQKPGRRQKRIVAKCANPLDLLLLLLPPLKEVERLPRRLRWTRRWRRLVVVVQQTVVGHDGIVVVVVVVVVVIVLVPMFFCSCFLFFCCFFLFFRDH